MCIKSPLNAQSLSLGILILAVASSACGELGAEGGERLDVADVGGLDDADEGSEGVGESRDDVADPGGAVDSETPWETDVPTDTRVDAQDEPVDASGDADTVQEPLGDGGLATDDVDLGGDADAALGCRESSECAPGFRCEASTCVPAGDGEVCAPLAARCSSDFSAVEVCRADGGGFESAPCAPGTRCVGAGEVTCAPLRCEALEVKCSDGRSVSTCDATGTVETVSACGEDRYCQEGVCEDQRCEPQSVSCDGDSVVTCDALGAFESVEPCGDREGCEGPLGCVCRIGQCLPRVCIPSASRCVGPSASETCEMDGLAFGEPISCEPGASCVPGTGRCSDWICPPGTSTCVEAGTVRTCADDGQRLEDLPCAPGETCAEGECRPWVCAPETFSCVTIATRTRCEASGLSTVSAPCEGPAPFGYACLGDGRCVERLCAPGPTSVCEDATARRVCDEEGLGFTAVPCDAGLVCEAGRCRLPNAPPSAPTATLTTRPRDDSDLVCELATPSLDADLDDVIEYRFSWTRNGVVFEGAQTDATRSVVPAASTSPGDTFVCQIRATDGEDTTLGPTVSTTINTTPTLSGVALEPAVPSRAAPLLAIRGDTADADGDPVDLRYAWRVDGALIVDAQEGTLDPSHFAKGQTVEVLVTPYDGLEFGISVGATTTISNALPTAPRARLTASPKDTDAVICAVDVPSLDADGDPLTYAFTWRKNGDAFTGASHEATSSTVPHTATASGDRFGCTLTVSDGTATAQSTSLEAEVSALWRSAIYPEDWTPSRVEPDGKFLHDFSYAGYFRGERELPDGPGNGATLVRNVVTDFGADPTGLLDATTAIQTALDTVGAAGGGVVYLPVGTYRVAPRTVSGTTNPYALWMKYSHVILRGAGADLTFIYNASSNMRAREILRINPTSDATWSTALANTSRTLAKSYTGPTSRLELASLDGLEVGDWVVVRSDASADFIAEHKMTGWWTTTSQPGPTFYRQITAIDPATREITLDVPTRYALLTRDNARIYKTNPHIEGVGLEDFSIGNAESKLAGLGDQEYNTAGTAAYEVNASHAIVFRRTLYGWARRIRSYKPAENATVHILSNGLLLEQTRGMTVEACRFDNPQYRGGNGNGYGYTLRGNEDMLRYNIAVAQRHAYDFKGMTASGNVILRCSSSQPTLPTDFHMHLSMSNLIDNITLDGDFLEATVRGQGNAGAYHGVTTTQSVFWNTQGLAYMSGKNFIVLSHQLGWGYVIGTRGPASAVVTTPTLWSFNWLGLPSVDTAPADFVEGTGRGDDLVPASLYEDQFDRRMAR